LLLTDEIVVEEVKGDGALVVLEFLGEAVR
jgi:hypothetical protein